MTSSGEPYGSLTNTQRWPLRRNDEPLEQLKVTLLTEKFLCDGKILKIFEDSFYLSLCLLSGAQNFLVVNFN